jgi:hypothetical protein
MATSGQPLGDEEFVAYVLTGMDEECYNPLVSSLSLELRRSRLSSYTRRNLAMSIASTDNLVATPSSPSTLHPVAMAHLGSSATPPVQGMTVVVRVALSAALPCWPLNFRRGPSTDAASGQNRPRCQVCLKTIQAIRLMCAGSSLMKIFVHDNRVAAMASSSFGTHDSNWYMDCSATDHITSELAKLTMHERYNNND